jgi:hypothetical protein
MELRVEFPVSEGPDRQSAYWRCRFHIMTNGVDVGIPTGGADSLGALGHALESASSILSGVEGPNSLTWKGQRGLQLGFRTQALGVGSVQWFRRSDVLASRTFYNEKEQPRTLSLTRAQKNALEWQSCATLSSETHLESITVVGEDSLGAVAAAIGASASLVALWQNHENLTWFGHQSLGLDFDFTGVAKP